MDCVVASLLAIWVLQRRKSDIKSVWLWNLQIVKLLSSVDESKTVINSKDDEGWAPLHSAASIGKGELVEILLTRGADVNVKNNGGRTALYYAASKGWLEIAQLYFKSDERVPTELKKSIMQARGEKKLTHSQLAQVHYFSLHSVSFFSEFNSIHWSDQNIHLLEFGNR
ncbi:26S proteasome non-ATPase regulatory subunit 10-like [Brassica napus]|uniref:26S proteasome non-ATPase regulatory subunit 10-like n=1 Tax=Brassica napus TaxID=3708 RepID=UPI002078FEC9|nr:26S proteasome non-ATPase regulatory subunit 10-like [Brassica napus]